MEVNTDRIQSFAEPAEFFDWLKENHAKEDELWLKIYKKASNVASVTWEEAVIEAIAWGWIDGIKKSCDHSAYFQRFTPRSKRSNWSKRNCGHAENLILNGRMNAAGLKEVERAKSDGRWDAAYAGSADMVIPEDFLAELSANKKAAAFFKTLKRANLFAIYHRLHSAKTNQTRQNRMDKIIAMLERGETFH